MLPRLVPEILPLPEISPLYAFCDVVGVGIGDSRSWIKSSSDVCLILDKMFGSPFLKCYTP